MPIARIPAYPNPEIASPAAQAVFSPNGKQVAAISLNGWAGIFDSQTGGLIRWLSTTRHLGPAHPLGAGTGVAWSSDGRFVVTTATDSVLHVWNPSNGKLLATLRGHVGRASSPSFAPNSDLVVTAGADRTARVWNVATDRQVALLRGGVAAISAAAFSPDGRWVVTGDAAGVTDVWDWRRQKLLGALPMHSDYVNAVSFAPHGRRILSASNDSTAKIYTCNTCVSLARLRAIVDRREHVIDTYGW